MKKLTGLFCACALICAFSVSCYRQGGPKTRTAEEEKETAAEDATFTEYSFDGTSCEWVNLPDVAVNTGKIIVIDSDEELKKYVEGNYPAVDFSKKTLLLAYGHEPYQNTPDDKNLQEVSERGYVMTVNLQTSLAAAELRWRVAIIIDKLSEGNKVELNITRNVRAAEGTQPISANADVAAFFKENLDLIAKSVFRNKDGMSSIVDGCVMINSAAEYAKFDFIDDTLAKLPEIDFDANTLVIGIWVAAHGGTYLVSQNIVAESETVTMNLVIGRKEGVDYTQATDVQPFWGLYPKIAAKTIRENVVFKE